MEKYLKIYLNWRTHALFVIAAPALILILCECDNMLRLAITKAAGLLLAYIACLLGSYWYRKGNFNELTEVTEED